jgi:hypothetical protein
VTVSLFPPFPPSLEHAPAAAVAAELGMTVNAVQVCKPKVLKWLRTHVRGLIDES